MSDAPGGALREGHHGAPASATVTKMYWEFIRMLRQFCFATLATAALVVASAAPARADIIVVTGVNNQGTDNVLLNPATNVLTVTGTVGVEDMLVNFTSSSGSGLLNANPSGQAT